ncbi:MAG: beta-propeller fold lactonase family protein [Candidatus Cybelea sp.]
MQRSYRLVGAFLSAALLAACGGNNGISSSVPPSGVAPNSQTPLAHNPVRHRKLLVRLAYVINNGSSSVSAYSIDPSGVMTQVPGSPFVTGYGPEGEATDPKGDFVYVSNAGDDTVSAYKINATSGALTPVAGSPFGAGSEPGAMAVDPNGKFAYVANAGSQNVSAYTISTSSGALTQVAGSPFSVGSGPDGVAVDPTGKFAYVANLSSNGPGTVSAFKIDETTGQLTQVAGSPFSAGSGPEGVAVDPTGKFAYVANGFGGSGGNGNVSAYTIDATTGALKPAKGSPFEAGYTPTAVAIDPNGRFAYVGNDSSGNVSAFTINAKSGALKPVAGSPFKAGTYPTSVAVDPKGKFAYVSAIDYYYDQEVSAYTIDATTGALTSQGMYEASKTPYGIAVKNLK